MERVVHKAMSFKEADNWDRRQQAKMLPQQRIMITRALQQRVFGLPKPIRKCVKNA